MAEAAARLRLVKCPKCRNILTEFANVPVYKCGACDATLRAKHSIADVKNDAVGSAEKVPENTSFDVSSLEEDQMNSRRSDSKDGITDERSLNLCSSDHKIDNPRPDEKVDIATRDPNAKKEDPDWRIQVEEDECSKNQVERSPKITRREEASFRLSDKMKLSNDDRDVRAPNDHSRLSKGACARKEASFRLRRGVNMDYARQVSLRLLRRKILLKVDELRDELDALFDKSAEERMRTLRIPSANTPRNFRHAEDPIFARRSRQSVSHSGDHSKERMMRKPREHLRPVSGGAPFVICHNCLKLLTLPPTDLRASEKQPRVLECGSCSKILTFSCGDGTRSSPRTRSTDVAHPNSEASSAVDVGTGSATFDPPSFGISFSTEAEIARRMSRDSNSNSNSMDKSKREGKQVIGSRVRRQMSRTSEHVKEETGAKDDKGKGILI